MAELIGSIVLLYIVVGSAAIWYRRTKARLAAQDEQNKQAKQAEMRLMPRKG
ncbi:MAG: hypothetical protein GY724_03895 [Actinomycetia bacterium]|nr:hypothetical protein [Actinomycetes bacterium]MCP4224104.1 hypothetical protein [Actinomycetes bacterium]MCP5034402.1 hypothetical protein [Actinomycetes bacterium]